jgi:hypothetical protein
VVALPLQAGKAYLLQEVAVAVVFMILLEVVLEELFTILTLYLFQV